MAESVVPLAHSIQKLSSMNEIVSDGKFKAPEASHCAVVVVDREACTAASGGPGQAGLAIGCRYSLCIKKNQIKMNHLSSPPSFLSLVTSSNYDGARDTWRQPVVALPAQSLCSHHCHNRPWGVTGEEPFRQSRHFEVYPATPYSRCPSIRLRAIALITVIVLVPGATL